MSPRLLDPESVDAKIRTMEPLVERLAPLRQVTAEQLDAEFDVRLVVERVLTVVVDLAVAVNTHVVRAAGMPVPADYQASFAAAAAVGLITSELAAALAPSAGLRNVLIRQYAEIDLDRLAVAVPLAFDGYRAYVHQASQWLLDRSEQL